MQSTIETKVGPTIPGAPHRLGHMAVGLVIAPPLLFVAIVLVKSAVAPQHYRAECTDK